MACRCSINAHETRAGVSASRCHMCRWSPPTSRTPPAARLRQGIRIAAIEVVNSLARTVSMGATNLNVTNMSDYGAVMLRYEVTRAGAMAPPHTRSMMIPSGYRISSGLRSKLPGCYSTIAALWSGKWTDEAEKTSKGSCRIPIRCLARHRLLRFSS